MRYIYYGFLLIFVFVVYFYVDLVTDFLVTHGIVKLLRKFFKNVNLRKLHNFICSKLKSKKSREWLLKIYNNFTIKFRK